MSRTAATLAIACPPRRARNSSRSRQRDGGRCPRHHVAKLPTDLSGRDVRAALERVGFVFRRQAGSHMMLRRDRPYARVVVPDHKPVRLGTLPGSLPVVASLLSSLWELFAADWRA